MFDVKVIENADTGLINLEFAGALKQPQPVADMETANRKIDFINTNFDDVASLNEWIENGHAGLIKSVETKGFKTERVVHSDYHGDASIMTYENDLSTGALHDSRLALHWYRLELLREGLSEKEADEHCALFRFDKDKIDHWQCGLHYPVGFEVMVEGIKYRCRREHVSKRDIDDHIDDWEFV